MYRVPYIFFILVIRFGSGTRFRIGRACMRIQIQCSDIWSRFATLVFTCFQKIYYWSQYPCREKAYRKPPVIVNIGAFQFISWRICTGEYRPCQSHIESVHLFFTVPYFVIGAGPCVSFVPTQKNIGGSYCDKGSYIETSTNYQL